MSVDTADYFDSASAGYLGNFALMYDSDDGRFLSGRRHTICATSTATPAIFTPGYLFSRSSMILNQLLYCNTASLAELLPPGIWN